MEQNKCTGNCLNCLPAQRGYCASQHAYSNMKVLDKVMETIIVLQESINTIGEKVDAMQTGEADVFNPNEETAQEGDGAEVIDAPK